VIEVGVAKGRPTAALHSGGVGGEHGQAMTVPEVGLDLSALELHISREQESDQASRGRMAGAAKKVCAGALAPFRAGVIGVHQGIGADLCRAPGSCALHGGNGAQAVGTDLTDVRSSQISGAAMKGLPLWAKHITAGAVKRPEGLRAAVHGAVCGGGRGEVCGDAVGGAGVGQAQTGLAMGEGDLCGQRSNLLGQAQEGKHAVHRLLSAH
jgi:hypothetical protein